MKTLSQMKFCFAALLACVAFCSALRANAQTVRPLIAELSNPARGRVEYVNDSNFPLTVIVEAKSFKVSETGEMSYSPLDPRIKLKLSATSFKIPPQQSYFLFYEASADEAPSWFVIYAAFTGFQKTQQGLNVRLELPHTVYLLPKKSLDKAEVQITKAEYNSATKKLSMVLENTGSNFGRVLTSTLIGAKHEEGPGFPVFPHAQRRFEYTWQGDGAPQKIQLEFDKFKIEAPVTPSS